MRRNEKEIKDKKEIEALIKRAIVCRLGLSENNVSYIVPMNYGYEDNRLYFHCTPEGKKVDIIRQNNKVCFELDLDHEAIKSETPCKWSMRYRSVIGFGEAFFLDELKEKIRAMDIILQHYSDDPYEFSEEQMKDITVIKVEINSMTGKKSGY